MRASARPASDPRTVLGVGPTDDIAKIRRAYRRLVLECHPDRNPTAKAAARFSAVTEAYREIKRTEEAAVPEPAPRGGEPPILSWKNVETNLHFCMRGLGRLVRKAIEPKVSRRG